MRWSTYHRPRSLDEAFDLKTTTPEAAYIAGGTDLLVLTKGGRERHDALISLRSIPELAGITINDNTINGNSANNSANAVSIGATTALTDVLGDPTLRVLYPILIQAVRAIGSVQIRNVATLGGNLARAVPCADSAPALQVLDAKVSIAGPSGRREIPVDELFVASRETSLEKDEILTAIELAESSPRERAVFLKKTRVHIDLALASVAVLLEMDGEVCRNVRIAVGSVAPTPLRLREVESFLEGQEPTPDVLKRAQELARDGISPISDVRTSADYRRHITGVLLSRAISTLSQEEARS